MISFPVCFTLDHFWEIYGAKKCVMCEIDIRNLFAIYRMTGNVDLSDMLGRMDDQIMQAKEEVQSRKDILDRAEKWKLALEEENWLEEYEKVMDYRITLPFQANYLEITGSDWHSSLLFVFEATNHLYIHFGEKKGENIIEGKASHCCNWQDVKMQ